MNPIAFINVLKPGKLEKYKKFCAENLGPKRKEYLDFLKRYGLKNAKFFHHKISGKELIIVFHDTQPNALEKIKGFLDSDHPYDHWFFEQLTTLIDFESSGEKRRAELLFAIDVDE